MPRIKVLAAHRPNKRTGVAKRYQRILQSLAQKDTKVVISLGGGGIRMFAHTVALQFLESIGAERYISELWGSSGGAIIGLLYSMGVNPTKIQSVGLESLRTHREVDLVPSLFTVLKKVILESLFPTLSILSNRGKSRRMIQGFHDCQKKLTALISRNIQEVEPRYPFYCLAYNMETHQTDVLTPIKIEQSLYLDWMFNTDPLEAIIASSSIPILFVPKIIEDKNGRRLYVDGSTVEDVPSESIYKKWVRDHELGIETKKRLLVVSVRFTPYFSSLGLFENWLLQKFPGFQYLLLSAHYADLMRQARTKVQKKLLYEDPSVELWDINLEMPGGGLMNIDTIPRIIETAENELPRQFAEINDSLLV